jgi:2-oxo-3-hexenedioate decarboxylase
MSDSSIFQNPKSGSIKVTGNFDVVDHEGKVIKSVSDPKLCGCGLSQDKPFCDKSHANYVAIVTQALESARAQVKAIKPMGVWRTRANEIRQKLLENRIAEGEQLVGAKFGGALLKSDSEEKIYEGIFGFLTDAMQVSNELKLNDYIYPIAEAEVVFKLGKDLTSEITLADVKNYVSHLAAGIEIFDCRYGAIDPFIDDAIADNACGAGFAVGPWVEAQGVDLLSAEISIFENQELNQKVPATNIAGNPWQAVVNLSKKLAEVGAKLSAGSIIFSGSATTGIPMMPGQYKVSISGLGEVDVLAN